ncbi:pyrimidine 5'-nucleotidase [Candidatus Pelagibacter bacterium]|jgi:putative hydrolase of the HAD superfamily|nr:pyrimidine 5'-nucleotidase [Candidatus Pelagibacter bacterium]
MKDLSKIKFWLFDLDNTLYSGDTKVFDQVDKKMSKFISEKLNVSLEEAKKIQKNYFQEYNTTLNGMIKNHDIDAKEFLEFVHDVDLEFLKEDEPLKTEIEKLKGKKIIFTNGSRAHASNVTSRIGIEQLFDGVFDIVDSDFYPKPSIEPYKKIIENYKIVPEYCIFFEDIARNLKPAYELGMKTVWIENNEPWAAKYSDEEFVNYKTGSLTNFLKEINENR